MQFNSDIKKQNIFLLSKPVLEILLKDRTTKRNIIWATSDYEEYGIDYDSKCEIKLSQITGINNIIQPRVTKAKEHQNNRTRKKAEVFTPSWICNEQNNLIDEQWFGRKNVFNTPVNKSWVETSEKIIFSNKKGWKEYVDAKRLEISCGEAPYLVSRYDTVSGDEIEIERRIGLLDRKLRIVNENVATEDEWLKWTLRAFQSIYGYEYQGDNLLLARINLLHTFIDNMEYRLKRTPTIKELKTVALVISWNIWQMDGVSCAVPTGKIEEKYYQTTLFESLPEEDQEQPEQQLCRIKDWRANKGSFTYKSL